LEWVRAAIREIVGEPTMKVTVEEHQARSNQCWRFDPVTTIRIGAGNSNESAQFECVFLTCVLLEFFYAEF
jgi:hypothetical protein